VLTTVAPYRLRFLPVLVALALLGGTLAVRSVLDHPGAAFLLAEGGAEWIRPDLRASEQGYFLAWRSARFERSFELPSPAPPNASVTLRALRAYRFWINGILVDERGADTRPWRASRSVDVAPHLQPGRNELVVEVRNDRGPPALLLHAAALDLVTDGEWRAVSERGRGSVAPVTARRPLPTAAHFGTSWQALASTLPFLLAAFVVGVVVSLDRRRGGPLADVGPGHARVALLVVWGALALNNAFRLPLQMGMDVAAHYKYIAHIIENGSLPLATESWQAFQAPLFYLLAAPLAMLLKTWLPETTTMLALRVLPLLCGLAQVEIGYRTARLVFPKRASLQMLGTLVAGLLPMNLYISQVVGNEPLVGLLGAVVVYRCLALLLEPDRGQLGRPAVVLGALLGLALLSKMNALLLVAVVAFTLLVAARDRGLSAASTAGVLAASILTTAAVAGWFFAWTWLETGRPLWLSGGQAWWQEPGFRTPAHFLSFGEALVRPVYVSIEGFWDGLYATFWLDGFVSGRRGVRALPPWNYSFVLSMAPLSLPMTLAGLAGALAALRGAGREGRAVRFAVACVALYGAALLYVFATRPAYSVAKSTYTLALLPCYALLITAGFRHLRGGALVSAFASGYVVAWAVCAYAGYWVL
jgi:hypothetical protein